MRRKALAKKYVSFSLASILAGSALMLAGCGNTDVDTAGSASDTTEAQVSASDAEVNDDTVIKIMFNGASVSDDTAVLEKLNPYLYEKIGVTIEPVWETWGSFSDACVSAIENKEDIDIYFTSSWTADEYHKYAENGAFIRLDAEDNNLIDSYMNELWENLPQVLTDAAVVDGAEGPGVYAMPAYKDIAQMYCWDVNVEKLSKLGYEPQDIEDMDYYEMGELFAAAKERFGDDFYPLCADGLMLERMANKTTSITGGTGTSRIMSFFLNTEDYAEVNEDYGAVIYNKYATDEFEAFINQTWEYYEAGYIDPELGDAEKATEAFSEHQTSGDYLLATQSYAYGYETQASRDRGFEVAMVDVMGPYVDTTSAQGAMYAVSAYSDNPEKAVELLNFLNTDKEAMTLLAYGVEGIHYNYNEDGLIEFTDERENYMPWLYGMGNITILPETKEQGEGFWDAFKEFYGAAPSTPILGFAYDTTDTKDEIEQITAVVDEYLTPLLTGKEAPDDLMQDFLKALDDVGMETVIEDANTQLSEFLEIKE